MHLPFEEDNALMFTHFFTQQFLHFHSNCQSITGIKEPTRVNINIHDYQEECKMIRQKQWSQINCTIEQSCFHCTHSQI